MEADSQLSEGRNLASWDVGCVLAASTSAYRLLWGRRSLSPGAGPAPCVRDGPGRASSTRASSGSVVLMP